MQKINFKKLFLFLILLTSAFATIKFTAYLKQLPKPLTGEIIANDLDQIASNIVKNLPSVKTPKDVIITTEVSDRKTHLTYDIEVPIVRFEESYQNTPSPTFISFKDLQPTHRLLSYNGNFFLDNPEKGAKFKNFVLQNDHDNTVKSLLLQRLPSLPTSDTILKFNQTGVTALARQLNNYYLKHKNPLHFSSQIAPFLKSADFVHTSNEVSFHTPCQTNPSSTTLCAHSDLIKTLTHAGINIIELTGNHNNDYGPDANLASLKTYQQLGIKTFGGGKNEQDAKTPLHLSKKHTNLTLLGYNYSTSTKANGQGAATNHPGANIYDYQTAKTDIQTAKSKGNIVIVSIQFFECFSYPANQAEMPSCDKPIANQTQFFRQFIDLGADIVIGTQAHQPQTFEIYKNKPLFYGLGNLFFDQTYWPGTTRSLILSHYFYQNQHLQTKITPTFYDRTYQTKLMPEQDKNDFLNRLLQSKP